jgi:hypothetical protein
MRRGIWADQNTYALALAALGIARLGPDPVSFYEAFATTSTQDALAQLLAKLVAARTKDVPSVLRRQRIALLAVAGLFAITAIYSMLLLGVE